MGQQTLEIGVALEVTPDRLPHHRVLAHQHDGLSPQGDPDLLHLLGADIVGAHDEALGVPGGHSEASQSLKIHLLIEQVGQLGEVVGLPGLLVLPDHLGS